MMPVWLKTPFISASAPSHSSFVSAVFSASNGKSKPDFFTSSSSKWSSATTTLSKPLNWALSARSAFCFSFFWAFFSAFAAFLSSDLRARSRRAFFEDAATRFAMITPRTIPARVQNIESSARRVTEM